MNILFIGPYRQADGWGYAARDYIRALIETKHTVSCKPIFLGRPDSRGLDPAILKTERETFDSQPNVIIQNVLPPYMDYQAGAKNIGLCYIETYGLEHTTWPNHLNMMDEVWVPSSVEKEQLQFAGVTVPIRIVPMPMDCELIDNNSDKKWPVAHADDSFIFYTIGEYSDRKNLKALLIAFYREFSSFENVQLLMKVHKPGLDELAVYDFMANEIWALKKQLRLYNNNWGYPEVLVAVQHLSPEDIISIHNQSDCFVMPSRGESLCRPLMDALYVGNYTIVTKNTAMEEVNQFEGGINVSSQMVPAMTAQPPIKYLYTAHETWADISIPSLQAAMRTAYDHGKKPDKMDRKADIRKQYSYQAIAQYIEKLLS